MIEDTIRPGDLVYNPFSGSFSLYDVNPNDGEAAFTTSTVEERAVGLVIAVSGSGMFILTGGRIGWVAFGMFDRVL